MISPRGISDLFTFTRVAAANFLDEQGLVQSAAANVPRFEYDAMGDFLGLLLEGVDELDTSNVDWFNELEGTFFVEFSRPSAMSGGDVATIIQMDDGSSSNRYTVEASTSGIVTVVRILGSTKATPNLGPIVADQAHKLAFAYKLDDIASALDGGMAILDGSAALPTGMLSLRLGGSLSTGVNPLNGHIKEVRYYPRRLTNEELVALTT